MKSAKCAAASRKVPRLCCLFAALILMGCSSPSDKANSYYERGKALLEKGDLVKARLEFQNALQIKGTMSGAWYGLAEIAEKQGDWQKVYGLLNKVVELDPKNQEAQVKLGRVLLAAGQLDKAVKASEAAIALKPDDSAALALRAAVLYKLDDRKGAIAVANAALEKNPKNVDALVVLATERLTSGDPEQAIRYLDQGLALNEKNVALQLIKVQVLEKLARLDYAEAILRKLIALFPDGRGLRHILAQFYLNHNFPDKAEAEYRTVVTERANDVQAKLDLVRFIGTLKGVKAATHELEDFVRGEPENNELKFALIGLHRSVNDDRAAEAMLRDIVARAGDGADGLKAKGELASLSLARGDKDFAAHLVAEILAKDQRNERALLLRSTIAIDERRLDGAIADLRTILRDVPDSAQALLLLGKAHELAGSPELAEEHYLRAFQASKLGLSYGVAYAEFLTKRGNSARAEKVLEEVLGASPGYPPAMKLLAQVRLNQGNWSGAQEVANELRRTGAQGNVPDRILGAVAASQANYDQSIAAFKRAYQASPSDGQSITALVRTYELAGKLNEAISFLNSVLQTNPENSGARLLLGQVQMTKGDKAGAAQSFQDAIAREPNKPGGYRALATLHLAERRFDEANRTLSRGLAAVPGDFSLKATQAMVYESSGRTEEAIELYEALLLEQPNADVLANNLASLLCDFRSDQASYHRAYELVQRFKGSGIPQFKDTLGWASHKLGKFDEASSLLAEAADKSPNQPIFRYHKGMNYLALARKDAARTELQKAVELARNAPFPQVEQAKEALRRL